MKFSQIAWAITSLVLLVSSADAQSYCASSWKTGNGRISPQTLVISLDKTNSSFTKMIKDPKGLPKYVLSITPGTVGMGKDIIEWMVELEEATKAKRINLLKPTDDPQQDSYFAEDYPGWFYLGSSDGTQGNKNVLPFLTMRVIRIEGFYITLRVTKFKRDEINRAAIDSATFEVGFANIINDDCR